MKIYTDKSWITEEQDDLCYLHMFDYRYFDFVNNINDSNLLLQTDKNHLINYNGKKVLLVMEPLTLRNYNLYDLVISTHTKYPDMSNVIYYPLIFFHLNSFKFTHYILNRSLYFKFENKKKFCIFINSNGNAMERIDFFQKLYQYKHIDSYGNVMRNRPKFEHRHWTPEFLDLIRQYKFMICFENSDYDGYCSEKVANAYLGDTIPIYWGNKNTQKFLNIKSMVYIDDYNHQNSIKAINEIIELDNDDKKYLNKIDQPLFLNNQIPEEFELKNIKSKIIKMLN